MSKEINAVPEAAITATAATSTSTSKSLKVYFEEFPQASIRKLAAVTEINYGVLLKKSKDPIVGEAYDPEATNWKAVEDKLTSKGVDWNTLDWDAMNEGPNRKGGMLQKSVDAFKVGDKVYLRRNNEVPYEILYKTETHIVIKKVDSSEPLAWANNTFLINGPVFEPRTKSAKVEGESEQA